MSNRFFPIAERDVKSDVKDYLNQLESCWWFMPVNRNRKGVPDFIVCYRGQLIAIETKRPRLKGVARANPHQERELRDIRKAGGYAIVVTSVDMVKAFISTFDWVKTRVATNVVRSSPEPAVLRDGTP